MLYGVLTYEYICMHYIERNLRPWVWQCNRQAARPLQAARALGTFWGIELDRQAESQGFQDSSSGLAEGGGAGGVLCKIDSW